MLLLQHDPDRKSFLQACAAFNLVEPQFAINAKIAGQILDASVFTMAVLEPYAQTQALQFDALALRRAVVVEEHGSRRESLQFHVAIADPCLRGWREALGCRTAGVIQVVC